MTPGKQKLVLPVRALADAVAGEWDAQEDVIVPQSMPLTRAVNSVVEKVAPQFGAVADMLGEYAGTDLLCYRAAEPAALLARQVEAWDPILDWMTDTMGIRLVTTHGVMPVKQDADALHVLRARLDALDPYQLTALHDLVTLPGSLVLGLAVFDGRLNADTAHDMSMIDEEYQAEVWGRDNEAGQAAANRLDAMRQAEKLLYLLKS